MFQRTSGRMGREQGVAVFSPFLILSFLTVSVNITIGVACGEGYSGGRGGCFCPWEVWRGFAVATVLCMHDFWEIIDKPRQNCLNKCFCIKCKTKLHISFVAFAALFWNYQIMVTFLHRAFQLFVCVCCFFLAVKFVYLMMTMMMRVVLHTDPLNASQMGTEIQMYELVHCIIN